MSGKVLLGLCCLCGSLLLPASADEVQHPLVVETEPLTPEEQLKRFKLPPGFEIELVAAEPAISKPMNLNFDYRGRLFVAQSVEYPFPAEGTGRDSVAMIEDSDRDGRLDRVSTVVTDLNIPIGITPAGGDLVVYGIPSIRRHEVDSVGDSTERRHLFGPFGYDDTHGMNNALTYWIDGWIYACHGFRNVSEVSGTDGHQIKMESGNTYRFRPDGSRIEYFTHGQVNPFGLCFDPWGNVYTADCHSQPIYQLLRGAYYPSFGKPHDGLGFGPTLVTHSHGSTGIGGIVYYAADHFPQEYRDTIFVGNPITHRINHDRLEQHGSTYVGIEQPDFLVCEDPWFRPVDLQLGPDGALYVADFYNRIIGHYEVPLDHPGRDRMRGRIWRIFYRGTDDSDAVQVDAPSLPDLAAYGLDELWEALGSPNLTTRVLATHRIVDLLGESASSAGLDSAASLESLLMSQTAGETQRAHGLWALERLTGVSDELLEHFSQDASPLVRTHVMKLLAERSDWTVGSPRADQLALRALNDANPWVRRAAAEGLGRHPQASQVEPLLKLWETTLKSDTHMIHVVKIALREHLEQPDAYRELDEELVRELLPAAHLMAASLGVRNRASAQFIMERLQSLDVRAHTDWIAMLAHAVRFLPEDTLMTDLISYVTALPDEAPRVEVQLYTSLHQAFAERGIDLPAELRAQAVELADQLLIDDEPKTVLAAIGLAEQLGLGEVQLQLASLTAATQPDPAVRTRAMPALARVSPEDAVEPLAVIARNLSELSPVREQAVRSLAISNTPAAREVLLDMLPLAHRSLATELAAGLATTKEGTDALLDAVESGRVGSRLLLEPLVHQRVLAGNRPAVAERVQQLTKDLPPVEQQLADQIAASRAAFDKASPDPARGAALFNKHCSACHRIGDQGHKVGPELDGIGQRGLDRLLEDIIHPNRNVDPNFRTTIVETSSGQILAGLVLREEGQVLLMIDSKGEEQRIALDEIEQRTISPLSPMPANVPALMTAEELSDLVGFLLSQRPSPVESEDSHNTLSGGGT